MGLDKTGIAQKQEQDKRRCTGLGIEGSAYKKGQIQIQREEGRDGRFATEVGHLDCTVGS